MSELGPLLDQFRELTKPDPTSAARLRADLDQNDGPVSLSALKQWPGHPAVEQRVRNRISQQRPASRRRLVMGTVALCVAVCLVAVLWGRDVSLEEPLRSEAQHTTFNLIPSVEVVFQGTGNVSGTRQNPTVDWHYGDINFDVATGSEVALIVRTREGEFRPLGTVFRVERNALGTQVMVERGRVQVDCVDETHTIVGAGDKATCLPISAAGMLARARAQQRADASPAEVLQTAELALQAKSPPKGAVRGELLVVQMYALMDLKRLNEALTTADQYLDSGYATREAEVRSHAARMAFELSDCEKVGQYVAEGEENPLWARCLTQKTNGNDDR